MHSFLLFFIRITDPMSSKTILLLYTFVLNASVGTHAFAPQPLKSSFSFRLQAEKQATFGCGCFWKPSEEMLKQDGVIDTVVGYTGKPDATRPPNYESVCASRDWVEGVRVIYDDSKLSYEELLDVFYKCQEAKLGSRQYGSFVFAHNDEQREMAQQWIQNGDGSDLRQDGFQKKWVEIEPLVKFYQAEGYHQRYWQKQRPRLFAIAVLFCGASGFLDSFVPRDLISISTFHTATNGLAIAIALTQLLERFVDKKVVEM